MSRHKTVVFGLDGACFDLVEPWLDSLSTLTNIAERGGRTPLESCVPATTPPAWTTLTTGVEPGKHGVFSFYSRHRESYETTPVSDRDVHARRLWDYTTDAGLTSLVVNVPVTHPPRQIDGALVPGYTAPDQPETYPESVLEDLGHDNYRVYAPSESESVPDDQLLDEWLSLTRSRSSLTTSLMQAYDWDLLFLEFQKTDGAVHKFDHDTAIRKIYQCVDDCMTTVLDDIGDPVNVFVVSDHGIGQPKKWAIALNTWLRNEGHLETTTDRQPRQQGWLDVATADGCPDDETDDNVTSTLANVGLTRQRIERILSTVGLYDVARKVVPDGLKNIVEEEVVDQATSDAFYQSVGFSGVDTGITLNSAEFYDNGTLSPTEYECLRKKIIEKLRALEGPKGNAFSRVRPREAVYDGPQMYRAPDIILEQAPEYVIGSGRPRGKLFIRTESGRIDHTRDGLLLAAGPDIDSDWSLTNQPSIADVTPTLLSVLRCPLNERFDGTPLTSIIAADSDSEYRSYDAYTPHSDYRVSNENRDALRDRLSQMGYLE